MEMGRMFKERIIPSKPECHYTNCYCEENVWKLCEYVLQHNEDTIGNYYVVFISNNFQSVPLWRQKSGELKDNLAVWDYHVILLFITMEDGVLVYDLDTLLDFPCKFEFYITETIRTDFTLKENFHRKFRVIPARKFLEEFSSDRSRMMKDGVYIKPPPSYPCIRALNGPVNNLDEFISMSPSTAYGDVLDLNKFVERFSSK